MGVVIATVVAVVALIAVGVVLATRDSDNGVTLGNTTTPTSTADTGGSIGDPTNRPVTVDGDVLPPQPESGGDPAVGTKAPVLHGYDAAGAPITIDAAADGPYMVVFLAHWCPHCNREIPRLIQWMQDGGVPAQLKIIAVATAVSPSSANYPPADWLVAKEWPWPAMIDESTGDGTAGVAAAAYGATGWPFFVIVGADGKVKDRTSGEVEIFDLQLIVDTALAS